MSAYTGASTLSKLGARRDRVRLPVWVYVTVALVASTAYSFKGLYHTVQSREAFGATIKSNSALIAIDGRLFDSTTIGGLTAWRFGGSAAVIAAMMAILTVVRHTRAEEDAGRTELVSAAVVGRRAPLTAALTIAASASIGAGALTAIALIALQIGVVGALALGGGVAAGGIMFAGVAAISAQIASSSRGASGLAFTALGAAFLLRAVGDGSSSFLSWLSPIGWTQQVRPYAGERWWVFALMAAFTLITVFVAYALVGRRDVGAGLFPEKLGPPIAAPSLRSPFALAIRMQTGAFLGWAAGLFVGGVIAGSAGKNVGDLLKTSAQMTDIVGRLGGKQSVVNSYYVAFLGLIALVAAAYGITMMLQARSEETNGRAEVLLATPATRAAYGMSHALVALIGTLLLLVVAGLGIGITYGATISDASQIPRMIGAALGQWPAVAVFIGFAALVFGVAPKITSLAWAVFAAAAIVGEIGPLLNAPQWVMDLSPLTHSPKLPGGEVSVLPLSVLAVVAVVLLAAGVGGLRRRDIG
jgi:polyether ionophore transport system permease protein